MVYIIAPAEFVGGANETVDKVNGTFNPYAKAIIPKNEDKDRDRFYYWLLTHHFTTP